MIQTEDLTTKVEFGRSEKASIAVGASGMKLTLQMLINELNIGESFAEGDIKELPKIEMEFFSPKSVDVLIEALEVIKKNYLQRYGFALAC